MSAPNGKGWRVVCDDYACPTVHKSEATAETAKAKIERAGLCKLPHRIVEAKR